MFPRHPRATRQGARPWPATANGSRSSARRPSPTPGAPRPGPRSSARSPWPPRAGGGDPGGNPRLRTGDRRAPRPSTCPSDNIERAIKKGTGELEGSTYEELTYEGYGPGGAAILIEATTDNANRTVAEIRHAFSRNGGNLGATNSVAWMFDRKGQIYLDAARYDEDRTLEAALEAGRRGLRARGRPVRRDDHARRLPRGAGRAQAAAGSRSSRPSWRWCRRTP